MKNELKANVSFEDLVTYNKASELITVKPFLSEIGQLEVVHFIDRGQSYKQIAKDIELSNRLNKELLKWKRIKLNPFSIAK